MIAALMIAASSGELPPWTGVAATVGIAVIGAISALVVRKVRGPVTIQELWAENRALRAEFTLLDSKVDKLIAHSNAQGIVIRAIGAGFEAQANGIDRLAVQPTFTSKEQAAIRHARELLNDETFWSIIPNTKEDES